MICKYTYIISNTYIYVDTPYANSTWMIWIYYRFQDSYTFYASNFDHTLHHTLIEI